MRSLLKQLDAGELTELTRANVFAVLEVLFAGAPLLLLYAVIAALLAGTAGLAGLLPYLALLGLCFAAQALCSVRSVVAACLFAYGTGASLRLRLGEHLRRLPLGYFKAAGAGNMVETLLLDVFNVELATSTMYNKLVAAAALPVIVGVILALIDVRLTLLLAVTVPPALLFLWHSRKALDARSAATLSARREASSRILEYVRGIRTIKSLNRAGSAFGRLDAALAGLRDRNIALESAMGPTSEIYSCIAALGFALLIVAGSALWREGQVALPVLLLFMIASLKFYQPIMGIAPYFSMVRHLRHSGENIRSVLVVAPQEGRVMDLPTKDLGVRFEHVRFGYDDREVLRDISFTAPPRSMTALVGPSGAGKTTVANLLARFWDPDGGRILVGGQDVRGIDPETLLGRIAMVMQDSHIFHDTVANNIRFGKPDASHEAVEAAAKAARFHECATRLPDGYDTVLGEGGATLSGGEKRRIAIARAILKDAPIVVLDEATASLDPENEGAIQEAFTALAASRTVFVIAHRLSTIRYADQILFLDDGAVVEQGGFDQLLARNGRFRRFWDLQQHAKGWKINRQGQA